MHHILVVEDDPLQRRIVIKMLQSELAVEISEASDGVEALSLLKNQPRGPFSLALIDLGLPLMDGLSVLRHAQQSGLKTPFIVLTASDDLNDAVEAMKMGASDFIAKPPQKERLLTSVRNALAMRELREEIDRLQQDRPQYYTFNEVVLFSPSLKPLAELGKKGATSDIPILITGESGVGKEVFAHAIHQESSRRNKPFISVNCGALPDNLVESTLFGHEKGSFTGATSKALGKCREADTGILFLDEVGELKPDAQVKLLRMLQQGEIEPVGSSKPVKVDVRVVSATNRSLEQMVAQGRFREDLYYRLHGLPLHIAPLRERRGDIPSLAEHLLTRIALKEQRPALKLTEHALRWLVSYNWPGNVRELQHILARAVLLSDTDTIEEEAISRWAKSPADHHNSASFASTVSYVSVPSTINFSSAIIEITEPSGHLKTMSQIEDEIFQIALARHNSHIGRAAALGIGQSTLYKRIRKK